MILIAIVLQNLTHERTFSRTYSTIEDLKSYKGFNEDYKKLIFDHVYPQCHTMLDQVFNRFLFNSSEKQSKFIYTMAQGHTLYEILNVDPDLDKIQKHALNETNLYLDTNVIISLLLGDRQSDSVRNVIKQSKILGINLFITILTKKEFDNWLEYKKSDLRKLRGIPIEMSKAMFTKNVDAPLLTSYMNSLRKHSHQTVDQFCLGFEDITKNLKQDFNIIYDDNEDIYSYVDDVDYSKLMKSVYDRNITKSPNVVKHDVLNILQIKNYRQNNPSGILGPKAWFLTTDSSLWKAERDVFSFDEIRITISVAAWFQILFPLISPELKTENTTKSFSKLLSTNFGIDSRIKQEDILNISAAFYDNQNLNQNDFESLLGDKHVRNTLRKLHESQIEQNINDEEKWTRKSMNAISNALSDKQEKDIENAISPFKSKLDEHDKIINKQNDEIKQLKLTQEKNWNKNFKALLFVSIAIMISVLAIIYFLDIGFTIDNFLTIIGTGIVIIIGIFVPWKLHHK